MDEATREGILDRIRQSLDEMKDSLNLLMSGEMSAEGQKEIAEAIKKVFDKSGKDIPKAATHLIDSLMKGSCSKDNITSLVPRSIGTIWEVLLIGQIQLQFTWLLAKALLMEFSKINLKIGRVFYWRKCLPKAI